MTPNENSMLSYEQRILEQYNTEIAEMEAEFSSLTFDPNYDGIIIYKYIKCGKKGCRCSLDIRDRVLHGPYPHFQYRENGILHQKYLNRKNVREYREKVDANIAYKNVRRKLRQLKRARADFVKSVQAHENNNKEDGQ